MCIPNCLKVTAKGRIPAMINDGFQYQKVETGIYIIKTDFKDSCVKIHGKVCLVKILAFTEDNGICVVYSLPLDSNLLGICKFPIWMQKCVILPFKKQIYCFSPFTDAVEVCRDIQNLRHIKHVSFKYEFKGTL